MRALAALIFIFCGSCSWIPGTSAHAEKQARDALRTSLFDADSAKFDSVKAVTIQRANPERVICGMVNAKNQMGAYVGFRRFLVSQDADFAAVDPQADEHADDETKSYQAGFDAVWPDAAKAGCR